LRSSPVGRFRVVSAIMNHFPKRAASRRVESSKRRYAARSTPVKSGALLARAGAQDSHELLRAKLGARSRATNSNGGGLQPAATYLSCHCSGWKAGVLTHAYPSVAPDDLRAPSSPVTSLSRCAFCERDCPVTREACPSSNTSVVNGEAGALGRDDLRSATARLRARVKRLRPGRAHQRRGADRARRVAELAARGLTNRQIASELVVKLPPFSGTCAASTASLK
jgi:hypothetical protein